MQILKIDNGVVTSMDIQMCYTLGFPVDVVFAAWISNEYCVAPITSIEVDPREGGVFRLRAGSGETGGVMEGEVLRIEENSSIRYTWHWGRDAAPSIVDAQFSEVGRQTRVDISHAGLESAESAGDHRKGWDGYIKGLEQKLRENVRSV